MRTRCRYFISQVANTIAAFEDGTLVRYNGDYKFFMDSNARIAEKVCVCVCVTTSSGSLPS